MATSSGGRFELKEREENERKMATKKGSEMAVTTFMLCGPRHSGKQCVLGRLAYEGSPNEREVRKAEANIKDCAQYNARIDSSQLDILKWSMFGQSYWRWRDARVPRARRVTKMVSILSYGDGSPQGRDFHRCLFTAEEVIVVLGADMQPDEGQPWETELHSLALVLRAFNRRPCALLINKMDLLPEGADVPAALVERAGIILGRAGLAPSIWTPQAHGSLSQPFRARIFAFLCVRCRYAGGQTMMPRDILYKIIRLVAALDGALLPCFPYSCAFPRPNQGSPILALLDARAAALRTTVSPKLCALPLVVSMFESYTIKGVGQVVVGRIVQGTCRRVREVTMMGTTQWIAHWRRSPNVPRFPGGVIVGIESFHESREFGLPNEFLGIVVQGARRLSTYHDGGVLVSSAASYGEVVEFDARIRILITQKAPRIVAGKTTASIYAHCHRYLVRFTSIEMDRQKKGLIHCKFHVMSARCFLLPHPSDISYFVSYSQGRPWFLGAVTSVEMRSMSSE